MTDTTDIKALREAALKATPGNWKLGVGSTYAYVQASIDMKLGGKSFVKLCHVGRAGWRNQQSTIDDARFIALANPSTIIALLDQLEAATALAHSIEEARCNNFSKSGAQFWSDPRIITLTTQLIECFELDLQDLMTSGERQDENK